MPRKKQTDEDVVIDDVEINQPDSEDDYIETIEAEDVDEQDFFRKNEPDHDHEKADVENKSQMLRLYHEKSNLELDFEIRKRNADFSMLVKKVGLGFGVLFGVLGSLFLFIELVADRLIPDPVPTAQQSSFNEPVQAPIAITPVVTQEVSEVLPVAALNPDLVEPVLNVVEIIPEPAVDYSESNPLTDVDNMLVDMLDPESSLPYPALQAPAAPETVVADLPSAKVKAPSKPQPQLQLQESLNEQPELQASAITVSPEYGQVKTAIIETTQYTPAPPIETSIPKGDSFYVISWGDTFFKIAVENNISVERLASINGLEPPYNIRAGQKLFFGRSGDLQAGKSTPVIEKTPVATAVTYKVFATTPSSVWVIDSEGNSALEARLGSTLGSCGEVLSFGGGFDRVVTAKCADIL